jgi:hypothetical protein
VTTTQITSFHPVWDTRGVKCPAATQLDSTRAIWHFSLARTTQTPDHVMSRAPRQIKAAYESCHCRTPTQRCINSFFPSSMNSSAQDAGSSSTSYSSSAPTTVRCVFMLPGINPWGPINPGHSPENIIPQAFGVNICTIDLDYEQG